MILDYIFYRAFDNFRKQKCDKEDARDRSCWVVVWMIHIIILPVSFTISDLFCKEISWLRIIPYVIFFVLNYSIITNRYSRNKYKTIIEKNKNYGTCHIPTFVIWLFVVFSLFAGMFLCGVIHRVVTVPLGLEGCLMN